MKPKLLRVLEETVRPVGSSQVHAVDVRIVAAMQDAANVVGDRDKVKIFEGSPVPVDHEVGGSWTLERR